MRPNESSAAHHRGWPSRTLYHGWDWVIRSYDERGRFMVETAHRGELSMDMELAAIEKCGRTADVFKVKTNGRIAGDAR